jgi:ABC-type transport system involved in Fe-S cluster assembly fused permease/ATPase subunit
MNKSCEKIDYLSAWEIITKLLPYVWSDQRSARVKIVLATVLTVITIVTTVVTPLALKYSITLLSRTDTISSYNVGLIALVMYGLLWTLSHTIAYVRELILSPLIEQGIRLFTKKVFEHVHTLDMNFHRNNSVGETITAITQAHTGFTEILGRALQVIPISIEVCVATTILYYFYGLLYSMLLLGVLTGYTILTGFFLSWLSSTEQAFNQKLAQTSSFIGDSILNAETTKYFNNQHLELQQCDQVLRAREIAAVNDYWRYCMLLITQCIAIGFGLTLLTVFSGYAITNKTMNIGDFILINGYLLQFITPLSGLSFFMHSVRKSLNKMRLILELLETDPKIVDPPAAFDFNPVTPVTVMFNNVWFGYDAAHPIIRDLSFVLPAGKTVALVGSTGAGKSTISRLLYRLYDVDQGNITILGHDIRNLSQESLRAIIGIVPQDIVLFNNSIYYNIAYGNPQASQEQVEQAARLAGLSAFISTLTEGYQTVVGERGLKISGGEKQRIAIARVILKQPLIYIFDEATSSLDMITEKKIQQNLQQISAGSTTLIIAHRLSSIVHADVIIVLDQGHVVEQGTHDLLLKHQGLYARLCSQQQIAENTHNIPLSLQDPRNPLPEHVE